ncbi:MAG: carboxypeptidase-like regulatory domain-containing protein [Bryobacteraceae bacterium]
MHWKSLLAFTAFAVALFAQVGGTNYRDCKRSDWSARKRRLRGSHQRKETKTNDQGVYTFPAVAVGQYNVEISGSGFTPYRRTGLAINVNSAPQVDATLQLASETQTVNVSEEAAQVQVEKADTQLGQTLTTQRITEVPLNGRSYTDLLAVQTGVAPVTTSATSSTSSGGSFGAVAPSGELNPGLFSVNVQRESANGFILNGANVEEGIAEGAAIIPNLDSIAEFRVLTSNFDAEYGNYSGGLTFNHAQFFGANSVDGNFNDPTFGQAVNAMSPRLMQAALKFRF